MTVKRILAAWTAILLAMILAGCGGGSGTTTGSSSGGESGSGGTATATVVLALTTLDGVAVTDNTLTAGTPLYVSATVRDASGTLVPNAVVTFVANAAFITLSPASGTALTDAHGVARVTINAASLIATGATTIQASAQFTSGSSTVTASSGLMGIAVGSANVTLGTMTIGTSSISAYGSTSISVPVYVNGVLATVPISVTFTSGCVSSGRASMTSPVSSVSGVAMTTYKDNKCASAPQGEVVTASVAGTSATATGIVIALAPQANNIQFQSATPTVIATHGTGSSSLPQSSIVKFKVVDANNSAVSGKVVNFSLTPSSSVTGVTLSSTSETSDASGEVSVSVTSGTVPTPVWVVATLASNPSVVSQSNALTVTTGLPTQDFFSLSVGAHNIDGWSFDGVETSVQAIASDRLGNPVPDGTVINFISEGGQIQGGTSGRGACSTTAGSCSVTMRSANKRPTNGRVSVLAYMLGEKSFVDTNGNNIWDAGETFYDLGNPFVDANENGLRDSGWTTAETYINSPASGVSSCLTQMPATGTTSALPAAYGDALSVAGTCTGRIDGDYIQAYVRRGTVIVFSGDSPTISTSSFSMGGLCGGSFGFWLKDENSNPMAMGTVISVTGNTVMFMPKAKSLTETPTETLATIEIGNPIVGDSTHVGGTYHSFSVSAPDCDSNPTPPALSGVPKGVFYLKFTPPKGPITTIPVTISQ